MRVSEYINYLVTGDISKLAVSNVGDLSINPITPPTDIQKANQQKIISYLNLANIAIHKKFHLLKKEFELWYPRDGEEFDLPKDFMTPISAYYAEDKVPVSIKDHSTNIIDKVDTNVSLLFTDPYKIKVKGVDSLNRDLIILNYAASPARITNTSVDLRLPVAYTEAFLNYAAYKAHAAVSANMQDENNTYYLRYQNSCKELMETGLHGNNEIDTNTKLKDRGFV